jgi:hypothetical protein
MFLEKWYADVVDENRANLLYRANLRLGPAVFGYEGRINSGGRASASFVAGGVDLPREVDGAVLWPAAYSGDGQVLRWANSHPREITLWCDGRRLLNWNPLVLNGAVLGSGLLPEARGYVERLTLNFGPWQLGLDRLKWGRFCGQQHSLVWIEWEGRLPKQLALLDGQARQLHEASSDRIEFDGAVLRLTRRRVLVQESMLDGALRGMPLPGRLAALRFFRGRETKWISPGTLDFSEGTTDSGHAISEDVVWS